MGMKDEGMLMGSCDLHQGGTGMWENKLCLKVRSGKIEIYL